MPAAKETETDELMANIQSARMAIELTVHLIQKLNVPRAEDILNNTTPVRKGRVGIIAATAAQVALLTNLMGEVSVYEVDKSLIDICSSHSLANKKWEITVVDIVQTNTPGISCLTWYWSMRVFSRAIYAQFCIGNIDTLHGRGNPSKIFSSYHQNNFAVVTIGDWSQFCTACRQAGHNADQCKLKQDLFCHICSDRLDRHRRHSGRDCDAPDAHFAKASNLWAVESRSIDSVTRNPFGHIAAGPEQTDVGQKRQRT